MAADHDQIIVHMMADNQPPSGRLSAIFIHNSFA
jgi:hypothetical protein